ncbi:MAG: peptidyl-prolyl cis-trans isomerase [Novosphingobium sp.]
MPGEAPTMIRNSAPRSIVLLPLLLLFACNNGEPSGQVVATVDGEEITSAELQLEMGQSGGGQPGSAQQAALQRLITRKLLVKEAERRKLDDTPKANAARSRARELALVQLLQSDLDSKAGSAPTEMEVDRYVTQHPERFTQRQLISVDRLIVSNATAGLLESIKARQTLPDVEALLTAGNIPFVRSAALLDSLSLDPEIVSKITKMGPGGILVLPTGTGAVQVVKLTAIRSAPVDNDDARNAALQVMLRARSENVRAAMAKIIADGRRHMPGRAAPAPSGSSLWR